MNSSPVHQSVGDEFDRGRAPTFKNQEALIDFLYRINGLSTAIGAIIGLDNEIGPNERFSIRMVAETLDIETSKILSATEKGELMITTDEDMVS